MRRAAWVAVFVLASACTGGSAERATEPSVAGFPTGGTLRLAMVADVSAALDPQQEYYNPSWELFRCCLLRTLLSYNGSPTAEGGSKLFPDLATSIPDVSDDGLTWTFHIKTGLRYAPPLQDVEITARDLVRAFLREGDPRVNPPELGLAFSYASYYSVIEGFDDYWHGKADTISGLEAPDDNTLVVHLTQPAGDLGYRFAFPATAPIPPNPARPEDPLGVAEGHDDGYGRFLVASGPYMLEGSGEVDFSAPPPSQRPVSGYVPARLDGNGRVKSSGSITLVRNPSWAPSTDPLRGAYVDRIEGTFGGSASRLSAEVDAGHTDMVFDQPAPVGQVRRYESDPSLRSRLFRNPGDAVFYLTMNLAVPPFDDLHVRRALNDAIDRATLVRLVEQNPRWSRNFGSGPHEVAGHIGIDSEEGDLLPGWNPYPYDPADAGREMSASRYDVDGDGRCDASVCRNVKAIAACDVRSGGDDLIASELAAIGIEVRFRVFRCGATGSFFTALNTPAEKVALGLGAGWAKDYPDASTFFGYLFRKDNLSAGCCNYSLLGASPAQLRRWGYPLRDVQSVDVRIDRCDVLTGQVRVQCWANLDQYMTTDVVPWVPYLSVVTTRIVSERVVRGSFRFDQFTALPALDHIALLQGSG